MLVEVLEQRIYRPTTYAKGLVKVLCSPASSMEGKYLMQNELRKTGRHIILVLGYPHQKRTKRGIQTYRPPRNAQSE